MARDYPSKGAAWPESPSRGGADSPGRRRKSRWVESGARARSAPVTVVGKGRSHHPLPGERGADFDPCPGVTKAGVIRSPFGMGRGVARDRGRNRLACLIREAGWERERNPGRWPALPPRRADHSPKHANELRVFRHFGNAQEIEAGGNPGERLPGAPKDWSNYRADPRREDRRRGRDD